MGVTALAIFLLALPVITLCYTVDQRLIYVDSQTGVNDSSCWEGGYSTPCLSLNLALRGAQQYNHSTTILLQPGQHQLHSGNETQLRNMSQLAIVGNDSEGEVVIKCQPLAGLAFFESENIEMRMVKLAGCGALQNSTSKAHSLKVAVFWSTCKNILLTDVCITKSNGTGVIFYNPVGVIRLDRCQFVHNGFPGKQAALHVGGGGLVIEANDVTSQSSCTITNSTFINNTSSEQFLFLSPTSGLGKGGGISVVFKGGTANNTVQLSRVRLENNTAQFGGGLFLAFHDSTSFNTVTINGIAMVMNTAMLEVGTLIPPASGGGILISYVATGTGNILKISQSRFVSNTAQKGGGIAVNVVINSQTDESNNKLLIEKCSFENNSAHQGSSVFLSNIKSDQTLLNTTISFCNFTNGRYYETTTHGLPSLGSVFLNHYLLALQGALIFTGNSLSALSLHSSSIELFPSTQLQFINNSAINGAALHIVDCSSVVVNNNSSIFFMNNTASHHGGAIYSEICTHTKGGCFIRHSNPALHPDEWKTNFTFTENQASGLKNSMYFDFIRPCIWLNLNSTFCWNGWSFLSDSGEKESCLEQLRSGPVKITNTGPTKFTAYPGECINLQAITVYDDWGNDITDQTDLQVDVLFQTTHHRRQQIIDISSIGKCQCNRPIQNFNKWQCHYNLSQSCGHRDAALLANCNEDYANHSSQILVHPPELSGIVLDIALKLCDNGSTCDSSQGCTVSIQKPPEDFAYIIFNYRAVCDRTNTCNSSASITYIDADCKLSYPLPSVMSVYTDGCYDVIICGNCSDPDYGIAVNFPRYVCVKCEPSGLTIFLLLELMPGLIMILVLAIFHVSITNGNLNGFVFFSQMVSLEFHGLGFITYWASNVILNLDVVFYQNFLSIPLTVYSIWNLNFLTLYPIPFCIPSIRTTTGVILLHYVTVVCPLLFIMVSYIWIQCYNNGYRLVVCTTRPVHRLLAHFWRKLKIQPSLIDTYAGLLLLAYMRILTTSFKLLQFIKFVLTSNTSMDMNNSVSVPIDELAALGAVAVLCLLVFVALPMAFLILYPFNMSQRCLIWCRLDRPGLHALVDAYQGCFKNSATDGKERRYFAGIFLLFRAVFLAPITLLQINIHLEWVVSITGPCFAVLMAGVIALLRPYKKTVHNVIDFVIFLLLFIICMFNYFYSFYTTIVLFYFPFLCLLIYIIYCVFTKCCCCCTQKQIAYQFLPDRENDSSPVQIAPHSTSEVSMDNYIEDHLFADRVLNPSRYN